MGSFNTRSATKKVEVEIYDKKFSFDASPSNHVFVKKTVSFAGDVQKIIGELSASKGGLEDVAKAYDAVYDKEKEILDFILPGEWDGLFAEAGHDLLVMAQLVGFVIGEIAEAFSQGRIEAVTASVPDGAEEV